MFVQALVTKSVADFVATLIDMVNILLLPTDQSAYFVFFDKICSVSEIKLSYLKKLI